MSTILITGATDGIGRTTAHLLAARGARVVLHGRNQSKLDDVARSVEAQSPGNVAGTLVADLGSLEQVRKLAAAVTAHHPDVGVLLNNAGVFMNDRVVTEDGFEMTFAVNHLAPFLLTHLLLPQLQAHRGRVVNVSSIAHKRGELDFDNLQFERNFSGYAAYALSKLANVLFSVELAHRLGDPGLTVNSLHPGVVTTKLLVGGFNMDGPDSLDDGAATSVFLCTDPSVASTTGQYFAQCKPARAHALASDARACARFFDVSAKMVGLAG
jgi:NAD(P)-dependent dehydrogenase (short-subunit alcohol dehydrogenase family)